MSIGRWPQASHTDREDKQGHWPELRQLRRPSLCPRAQLGLALTVRPFLSPLLPVTGRSGDSHVGRRLASLLRQTCRDLEGVCEFGVWNKCRLAPPVTAIALGLYWRGSKGDGRLDEYQRRRRNRHTRPDQRRQNDRDGDTKRNGPVPGI